MEKKFPTDILDRLSNRVHSGQYQSEEEVLRDAMDALDQLEEQKLTRWREGNRIAQEQSQQGLSKPLDDEAVLGRLRSRLESEGNLRLDASNGMDTDR